jgi:undecaprenyl-diphosphatase
MGGATALLLQPRKRRKASQSVAAAVLGALLADHGLKAPFRRRRPPAAWFAHGSDSSFPSGHSMAAAAVPATVGYVLSREGLITAGGGTSLALVPPLAVGALRLYLRKHWLSDVLAGWTAGLAIAATAVAWYEWPEQAP